MYTRGEPDRLRREAETVRKLGFPAEFLSEAPLPVKNKGGVKYPGMAQFHPLKFIAGAVAGLSVYEDTFVYRLEGTEAYTKNGRITANKVIVATHFPFINSRGLYFMKLYQKRSFVVALENAPELGCTAAGTGEESVYFRNYKNLLLVGGGDHRTGTKGGGFEAVRRYARRRFPGAKEKYAWAAQDCMSLDGAPYIGRYSPRTPTFSWPPASTSGE
jgi:glycine/D-amino acid oxidase-like deaminating enzyme